MFGFVAIIRNMNPVSQVYALVLEGRFREARELLMKHSAHRSKASDVSGVVITCVFHFYLCNSIGIC